MYIIGVAWVFFLVRQLKNSRGLKRIFPEFKWIMYDFNNNRNNTQKLFRYASSDIFWYIKTILGELYLL